MNSQTIKKIVPIINLELLYDFRSILYTVARFTNEKNGWKMNFSQNFFNSITFNNIDQFVQCLSEKINFRDGQKLGDEQRDTIPDNYLRDLIINSDLFQTIKPRLCTLSEIFYICDLNRQFNLDNEFEIILFSREIHFL